MVSWLRHTAASATQARQLPGAARFAVGVGLAWPPMAGSRGSAHVEHEKKTFFSSLKNSRRGAVSQGRPKPGFPHERSVLVWDGEGSRVSGRSEAQSLYGRRSGGYTRVSAPGAHSASILCFQHVDAAATQGYSRRNRELPIFPLVACFQHVYPRKHVNVPFSALATHIALALLTLTAEEPQVPLQQPAGGEPMKALAYPTPGTLNGHRRPHAASHRVRCS